MCSLLLITNQLGFFQTICFASTQCQQIDKISVDTSAAYKDILIISYCFCTLKFMDIFLCE